MKLKLVQRQDQPNHGSEKPPMKNEVLEPEIRVSPEVGSSTHSEPFPVAFASDTMLLSGKRKRKPKLLIDDETLIIRQRKKKATASKSNDLMLGNRETLASNRDSIVCALSTPVLSKSPTLIRAEEFRSSLGNDQPSFLKVLVRSHVGSCFWMGLPMPFCKLHLPSEDTTAILENENGDEFSIKYIAHKTGLSAGWRKFVAGNKLLEGDVLVFKLVGPCRFKVYIIRANDLSEVDGALSLLILDSQTKQSDAEGSKDTKSKKQRRPKSHAVAIVQKQNEGQTDPQLGQLDEHSGNNSEEVASEVLECSKFSESSIPFKDVKSFEEFHIVVNGVCIDSELSENTRKKYYELCCSKNYFLHNHLLPGLCNMLIAGAIFETVAIADAIRGCKLTTSKKDFEVWEKSLRSFELLGLNLGFLLTRLRKMRSLALETEGALEMRRYWDAKTERSRIVDEICALESKMAELKDLGSKFDHEIDSLKMKAETYELNFQQEANAEW